MAKSYKLTESEIPERRTQSVYADVVADFIAQGTESMQVTIEGMKPATLRAGLRRALKGKEARREDGAKRRGDVPGKAEYKVVLSHRLVGSGKRLP